MAAGQPDASISEPGEMAAGQPDGGEPEPQPIFMQILEKPVSVIGQIDYANRYLFVVEVHALKGERHPYRACGGALIASNLVLTAAHCLCEPTPGQTIRSDSSQCLTRGWIRVRRSSTANGSGRMGEYTGDVSIHPRFQLVLDTKGAVVSSHADLAVIHLKPPVPQDFGPVRLASEEAWVGEVLSAVGYGFIEDVGAMDIWRRFSQEQVQAPAGDDRFLFGSMDNAAYKGDTGGPCLRETFYGLELVGISQRGLGLTPTFTNIVPYRKWLDEQIRLASGKP